MVDERCTVTEHGPSDNPYSHRCVAAASYQLIDENKEGFMCAKHARILRHMYEPGQVRKIRRRAPETGSETP